MKRVLAAVSYCGRGGAEGWSRPVGRGRWLGTGNRTRGWGLGQAAQAPLP